MNFFIVLDIETTGFSTSRNEIIEIGALKIDRLSKKVVGKFEQLISVDCMITTQIMQLTNITNGMLLKYGKPLKICLQELSEFCQGATIYAHNAAFDKRFIRHAFLKTQINFVESEWVDTISLFKKQWPNRKTYKLQSLVCDLGISKIVQHRAVSDAYQTWQLMNMCNISF